MRSSLRNTIRRSLWAPVWLCLAGLSDAAEPQPARQATGAVQASEKRSPGKSEAAPAGSAFSWLAAVAPGQTAQPLGALQRQQFLDSLLDHMRVHVSARLLDQLTRQPIEREFPVEDTILGISFSGKARSKSAMRVVLAPDEQRAVFDVVLTGVARSRTTGKSGPVCIHCQGVTRFTASKRFHLTDDGLTSLPVQCRVETNSTVTDITSEWPGLRGRIAVRLARRRSDQTHTEAEQISACHNQERIAQAFEEQMTSLAKAAETVLTHELLRGGPPDHPERRKFHFHTSRDYVCMASICGEPRSPMPPEPAADTWAKLWLPTAVIDLPLALTAMQAARTGRPEQWWRELTGRELVPWRSKVSDSGENDPSPMAVNVAVESGWLSLSMQPR